MNFRMKLLLIFNSSKQIKLFKKKTLKFFFVEINEENFSFISEIKIKRRSDYFQRDKELETETKRHFFR